jgi:hypothetical protein
VKSSRDWIASWACRHVSEETEQSSILMYGSPPRIRGSPHPIVQQSIWIPTLVFKEVTKTTNADVSPAGSKNQKQVEMEGHRDFIQECAVEDEEWKWSPVYLLLRVISGVSAYVPCPWKHTAEEWHLIQKFIQAKFSLTQEDQCNNIVVAS